MLTRTKAYRSSVTHFNALGVGGRVRSKIICSGIKTVGSDIHICNNIGNRITMFNNLFNYFTSV